MTILTVGRVENAVQQQQQHASDMLRAIMRVRLDRNIDRSRVPLARRALMKNANYIVIDRMFLAE